MEELLSNKGKTVVTKKTDHLQDGTNILSITSIIPLWWFERMVFRNRADKIHLPKM
jgi:hypothetical protein